MQELEKFKGSKSIFVVGIGGSDLASKAVWNAMTLHKTEVEKKIFFLESPDSREYEEVESFVKNEIASPTNVVMVVVSKSGKTAETLEAFHKTFDILSEKFGRPINDRVIVISSPNSPLSIMAEEKEILKLDWEGNVGGRFSAFTITHTAVLKIAGLDIEKFIEGSKKENRENIELLAKNIFDNYKRGADVLDIFIFNSELEDLGKWCRQLIAESLATFTPTVSLGPTDLHSMLELYLEKPGSRFTLFLKSEKEIGENINESAYEKTVQAYKEASLPFYKYEMPQINEYELGKFMAFMIEMVLKLAELLGVDPYDQPEVEKYKNNLKT